MSDQNNQALTPGAQRLVEAANRKKMEGNHAYLGINHWLLSLIERHAAMIESLVAGFSISEMRKKLQAELRDGKPGNALPENRLIEAATDAARQRGKDAAVERDLATVILTEAGYQIVQPEQVVQPTTTTSSEVPSMLEQAKQPFNARAKSATPTLDTFGRDLIEAARQGKLVRVLGRDEEIQLTIETLCRRTKRNPCLVGPAGVGKTAIAEGLAYLVLDGKVPAPLQNCRIIELHSSALVAGASVHGEMEKRMKAIISEASQDGIILFIDEIHTMMGSGGMVGTTDIASILKPALARGDMAVMAATTDEEYRRFIEQDSALERRFQPIRINPPSPQIVVQILNDICKELGQKHNITVANDVIPFLVRFAEEFMRNRHFPDKGVDLLEQCFAHAVTQNKTSIDLALARDVAQRMIGMPLALEERISILRSTLTDRGLLPSYAIEQLINRLQVTLRGLDLRTNRPNAIMLLSGDAANQSDRLAESVAEALFGSPTRVITIDFSRMTEDHDISQLIGAPPGYVGYSDSLPLHKLAQTPWCVLRFENMDFCHPAIRETVAQAFYDGKLQDARGRPIHFSDTIVILTGNISIQARHTTGFLTKTEEVDQDEIGRAVVNAIGSSMAEQIDLFVYRMGGDNEITDQWFKDHLISELTERYNKLGLEINWDPAAISWLCEQYRCNWSERDWEAWVDNDFSPVVIPILPPPGIIKSILVKIDNNQIQIHER